MARVQPYERVVDTVFIHISPALDIKIENGVKIKEEHIATTSDTETTEDYTIDKNCFSLIDHNYHYCDKSLSKNNISCTNVNNTENGRSSNEHNTHSNNITKNVNIKRKRVKEELCKPLILSKKQKCCNEISNNKNASVLCITTEDVKTKRSQSITLDCKTKLQYSNESVKEESTKCNICFRKFSSIRNCEMHKQCYKTAKGNYCTICNEHYVTYKNFQFHICRPYRYVDNVRKKFDYNCNFCGRSFKIKPFLQSHLFHVHGELISLNNTITHKTSKFEVCKVNTSPEDDTLTTNVNEESLCINNCVKPKEMNTTLTNSINASCDDNVTDTEGSRIEKPFNNKMSLIKRLRQPTLTEYLELCKKKRDIKFNPNKLNIVKDDSPTSALQHNEQVAENSKSQLSDEQNGQFDSLSAKSDKLPKQMALDSIQKQSEKPQICERKKPFVKLHADVEMMKSFLDKLSDTDTVVTEKVIKGRTSNTSYDHGIPYSLRSLSGVSSVEADSNLGKRQKNVSKNSGVDVEFRTEREQNVDLDKVDSKVSWKIITADFKFKECTIPLTRCDKQPRNSSQIPTIEVMKNTSLTTQRNFTVVQESDVQNKMMLKNLEISLERLTVVPTIDIKTEILDVEEHNNNCFLCKVCKKSFSSKLAKRAHIKSSHIAYMSSICEARYTLKHKLLEHYLRDHLFKQNQCCICHALLPDYEALKYHLNVHCLKYIQREDDRRPIDIEFKCNLPKQISKCLHCDKTFSSKSSLTAHQSCCTVQEKIEDQTGFTEESNAHPKDIPTMQPEKKTNENTVTCDERINPNDLCEPLNSDGVKESNKHQVSLHNEKELTLNKADRNFLINKEEKIETINKSQEPKQLFTSSNQNIVITQLNDTTRTMTYPCDVCGKQFHNPKNLEIHIRTFSFTTDLCPICGTGFSSKRLLQTHITSAHVPQMSKTYTFHCVFCNQGFLKKHDLRPHMLHLHSQQVLNMLTRKPNMNQEKSDETITNTATCNVCNLVFETHDRYVEHRMYYYKNHTFTCSLCAQNFQGMYLFHHHNKLIHYSEDKRKSYNYICDICKEGFNHESHFYSHNMHVHSNEVNLVEITKESEDRSRHSSGDVQELTRNLSTDQQKQNEQLSNDYTCQICHLKCVDMNHMVKHKEFYSNDGDFRCDKCSRRCRTFYLLDQHRKLTHIYRDTYDGHSCDICGEVLKTVVALKCHKKHFHSKTTDNNTDNCSQMSYSNVTYKMIEHSYKSKNSTCNVTEYTCLFCDMKFATASTVQTHIVHVHLDDMIAKQSTLKLALPMIDNDDIQKQFTVTKQIPSSSSSSTTISLSAADKSIQLLQRSTIQQSNNILNDTNAKNGINGKTIDLLKTYRVCMENKIAEKTLIPRKNKSKDNILIRRTIVSNTEPKAGISFPSSTQSTTYRIVAPSTKFGNSTSILLPSESTTDLRKSCGVPSKSGSVNEFKTNSSSRINRIIIDKSKLAPVYLHEIFTNQSKSLATLTGAIPQSRGSNEITNQKSKSVTNKDLGYSCPLCPLQYPSLMFFQGHLKYAHAASILPIRTDEVTIPQMDEAQRASVIECLLCPCTFTDEIKYKKHLRNSHTYYMYIPNSEETTKINNVRNPVTAPSNINKTNIIPETITVDDDDSNNVKNASNQGAAEVTTTLDHGKQNEKIGKLRVKSFAKIIENLSSNAKFQ